MFIPLAFLFGRKLPKHFNPVILYIILAFILNIACDVIVVMGTKEHLYSNNWLYNVHSIMRYTCFTIFLLSVQPKNRINRFLSVATLIWLVANFIFFEDFFDYYHISSRLFATETGALLIYCLQYYLFNMLQGSSAESKKDIWIVTGISIYSVFNFPFFLLYTTLITQHKELNRILWDFHNITYIVLCIFIARAFYVAGNK